MIGLLRVAIIVLIAFLAYRLVKGWLSKLEKPSAMDNEKIDTMVRCHYCDVHVPQNEAVNKNGHWYCCQQHAVKGTDS